VREGKSSRIWVCSSAGRAAISKVAGRGFESLRTRFSKLLAQVKQVQRANSKVLDKMEVKKGRSTAANPISGKKMVEFVGEVKQELKRVDWTNKEELLAYTKIILMSAFFFGMFVYFIDLIIQAALSGFNSLINFIS
jgi:preprotein translocase subunit SecE